MSKEEIREYGLDLGVDVIGFASLEDYKSGRSRIQDLYCQRQNLLSSLDIE